MTIKPTTHAPAIARDNGLRSSIGVDVRIRDRHPALGLKLREAGARVQAVRVARGEHDAAQTFEIGVIQHALHQPSAQSLTPLISTDVDVAHPRERSPISNDAQESGLGTVVQQTEAE